MDYKKVYIDFYELEEHEVLSEISGRKANDIHHIEARGMGGTSSNWKNQIWNLQAVTREEHNNYGDKKQFKNYLKMFKFKSIVRFLVKKLLDNDFEAAIGVMVEISLEKYPRG